MMSYFRAHIPIDNIIIKNTKNQILKSSLIFFSFQSSYIWASRSFVCDSREGGKGGKKGRGRNKNKKNKRKIEKLGPLKKYLSTPILILQTLIQISSVTHVCSSIHLDRTTQLTKGLQDWAQLL